MQQFIAKHQEQIAGVLSGFDRLVLRGTLRSIAYGQGMSQYLWSNQILLKDFGSHVEDRDGDAEEEVAQWGAGRAGRDLAHADGACDQLDDGACDHLTKAGRIATTAILTPLRSSDRQLTAAAA